MRIIILTAQDEVEDTVTALENGANDYVTKPFEFSELLARVRVQLRDSVISKSKSGKETTGNEQRATAKPGLGV